MQAQAEQAKMQADQAMAQGTAGAAPPVPAKQTGTQNASPPGTNSSSVKLSVDIDELVLAAERLFDVQPTLQDDL